MHTTTQQPQFRQPVYGGYVQGPPPNDQAIQYPPPPMPYPQAQLAQNGGQYQHPIAPYPQAAPPMQQQYQVQNAPYPLGPETRMRQNSQSLQPYTPPQAPYPQDRLDATYRPRESSQASRHSHQSHHSHKSHKSHRSKSREPERATLGDTLIMMWEVVKGAFDKRKI